MCKSTCGAVTWLHLLCVIVLRWLDRCCLANGRLRHVLCSSCRCILNRSCCCLSPHSVRSQAITTPSNGCPAGFGRQTTGKRCRSWTDLRLHYGFAKHLHRRTVSAYYFDHGQRVSLYGAATAFAELAAACFRSKPRGDIPIGYFLVGLVA